MIRKKNSSALTPMMLQYLVGLCYLQHDSDAINVTLGDMVYDAGAQEERDVDVTITIEDKNGNFEAFKVAEVKDEQRSVDVAKVEGLIKKLEDMPKVTHKAIFSTSGYSNGAKSKAKANFVNLYILESVLNRNFNKYGIKPPISFQSFASALLCWKNFTVSVNVLPTVHCECKLDEEVLTSLGKKHGKFSTIGSLIDVALMRSTQYLFSKEPFTLEQAKLSGIMTSDNNYSWVGTTWQWERAEYVMNDEAYIVIDNSMHKVESIIIKGELQHKIKQINPEFFILKNVFTEEPFAGAIVTTHGINNEITWALTLPQQGQEIGIHPIDIPEKQKNMIRNLRIK